MHCIIAYLLCSSLFMSVFYYSYTQGLDAHSVWLSHVHKTANAGVLSVYRTTVYYHLQLFIGIERENYLVSIHRVFSLDLLAMINCINLVSIHRVSLLNLLAMINLYYNFLPKFAHGATRVLVLFF